MEGISGKLTDDFTHTFPTIKSMNTHGKNLYWTIFVKLMQNDEFMPIRSEYYKFGTILPSNYVGYYKVESKIGDDGVIKSSRATFIKSGKNLGKKNETNAFQQALKDAQSKYNLQMKKSTPADGESSVFIPPMLAQPYSKHPPNFELGPVFVQRKFDGIRSLSIYKNGDASVSEVVIYSRKRNIYESPYLVLIKIELEKIFKIYPNLCIDGEIFNKDLPLQEISGMVRTTELNKEYANKKLYYKIYDIFSDLSEKFSLRLLMLDHIKSIIDARSVIHIVDTYTADNDAEVQKLYKEFRNQNYEGAIVRLDAPYTPSYNDFHSDNLLKIKPLFDAEFTLTDYKVSSKGKLTGAIVLICETDKGEIFNVNPAMSIEERIELGIQFEKKFSKYKGRKLIVEYENLSKKGIPLRARTNMLTRTKDDIIEKIEPKN